MALIKCSKCGKEVSDKAKTCIHCGNSLEKEKDIICTECGKKVKGNQCTYCGKKVDIKVNDIEKNTNDKSKPIEISNENNVENQNTNNNGLNPFIALILYFGLPIIIVGINFYFIFGTVTGPFGNKGQVIGTTWNTSYGELKFFKNNRCELYVLGSTTTSCKWKLKGKEVTINYTYNGKSGTINGSFNGDFTRFNYK